MVVLKMHYVIAGVAFVTFLATTGCCSSRSCCSRYGQNPVDTAAPVVAAPNAAENAAPQMVHKKCPVTDDDIGSMGTPIAVQVKDETVYVCCQGCVKKLQQNPDFYLAKVAAEKNAAK